MAGWIPVVLGLLLVGPAEAGMFRFVDEAGVIHYTNAPSDPRYRRATDWPESPNGAAPVSAARALGRFAESIRATAARYGVDWRLVEAVIIVESGGNPRAVSPKGATGLMQLMPFRAAELGVRDPFDPHQNLDGGVRHLRALLQRFAGDVTLALAAYNAGEEAVRAHGGVPPYRETQDYVRKVNREYGGDVSVGVVSLSRAGAVPERVYQHVTDDGTVVYTNLPPTPTPLLRRRF